VVNTKGEEKAPKIFEMKLELITEFQNWKSSYDFKSDLHKFQHKNLCSQMTWIISSGYFW